MPEVIFNGPEGRLEGRYHHNPQSRAPLALVLHPHPLYGGTMNNKIVYRLFQAFARSGFSVLRFNFRGVGRSLGRFDNGEGELSDAAAAMDWLQHYNPDAASCWVSGFSFGSWISMQLLMRRPEIDGFVAVSPPAGMYDFSFLSPCPASGLITQGDRDDIVKVEDVNKFAEKLKHQKYSTIKYEVFEGSDHYYRNAQDELEETVRAYIASRLEGLANERLMQDKKRRPSQAG